MSFLGHSRGTPDLLNDASVRTDMFFLGSQEPTHGFGDDNNVICIKRGVG